MILETKIQEKTSRFSISYEENRFILDFETKKVGVTFCELLEIRRTIQQFSRHGNLVRIIACNSLEILSIQNGNHFILLGYSEILELKSLITNFFAS